MGQDLNKLIEEKSIEKTTLTKRLTIGSETKDYPVYKFPLEYLYYNDQNGRINTVYHQYISNHGKLTPEIGESKYNEIFEKFIFESKKQALKDYNLHIKVKIWLKNSMNLYYLKLLLIEESQPIFLAKDWGYIQRGWINYLKIMDLLNL